jgi:ABC-type glycerol-3-phosphate transport system substrate-binding protein
MKKRILALLMTLVLLACSAPLTGVAAATAYDRPLAEPIGWSIPAGAPEDATPYGVAPRVVAATAKQDRTVDYLKILGISQATATKFGQRVRNAITNYKLTVDVSDLNIKVDFRYYKYYNAFWCLMDNEMYYHYNTFMYDFGTYTWDHKNYKVTKIKFNSKGFGITKNEYLHRIDLSRSVIDHLLEYGIG